MQVVRERHDCIDRERMRTPCFCHRRPQELNVLDEHTYQQGELRVDGTIGLAGLSPASWNLNVGGRVAGKMLLALAPSLISQASGVAKIAGTGVAAVKKTHMMMVAAEITLLTMSTRRKP